MELRARAHDDAAAVAAESDGNVTLDLLSCSSISRQTRIAPNPGIPSHSGAGDDDDDDVASDRLLLMSDCAADERRDPRIADDDAAMTVADDVMR